jgi:hypothetical protein
MNSSESDGHEGGSSWIVNIGLCLCISYQRTQRERQKENISTKNTRRHQKDAHLIHTLPEIDPVCLILAQESKQHAWVEPAEGNFPHAVAMESPQFRSGVLRHVVLRDRVQFAGILRTQFSWIEL